MKTLDLRMSWTQALPTLLALYAEGTHQGKAASCADLTRMAGCADRLGVALVELSRLADAARVATRFHDLPALAAAVGDAEAALARLLSGEG